MSSRHNSPDTDHHDNDPRDTSPDYNYGLGDIGTAHPTTKPADPPNSVTETLKTCARKTMSAEKAKEFAEKFALAWQSPLWPAVLRLNRPCCRIFAVIQERRNSLLPAKSTETPINKKWEPVVRADLQRVLPEHFPDDASAEAVTSAITRILWYRWADYSMRKTRRQAASAKKREREESNAAGLTQLEQGREELNRERAAFRVQQMAHQEARAAALAEIEVQSTLKLQVIQGQVRNAEVERDLKIRSMLIKDQEARIVRLEKHLEVLIAANQARGVPPNRPSTAQAAPQGKRLASAATAGPTNYLTPMPDGDEGHSASLPTS